MSSARCSKLPLRGVPLLLAACLPSAGLEPSAEGSSGDPTTDGTLGATGLDESSSEVPPPVCGDGVVDEGEDCDEGPANAQTGACTTDCRDATCGDGLVREGVEQCDDANAIDDDECSNACELPGTCGDGSVDAGEQCDDGPANDRNAACMPDCTAAYCGDGAIHGGVEQCDDANTDDNDACTQLCAPPTCGDGFAQTVNSELCDDGDEIEGDECNGDCTTAGLWTDTYNGAADNNDAVFGVATDGAGNVVVVGETFDAAQGDDIWLRKYSPAGRVQWTQTFHGVTADTGHAVAVDAAADIVVAGASFTLDDGLDGWVRRYSPAGSTMWTQTFNGAANGADEATGIAIDPSGNVLVVGYTTTVSAERDIWVRKYSPGGATVWTRTAAGMGGQSDEGRGIASDAAGNVVVTGFVWGGAQGREIWVRKYDAAGSEQWTQTYNAPQDGNDSGRGVAVDGDDAVFVAASIYRGTQSDNIWVRKYDSDGAELWTSTYNSDGFGSDVATAVAVDSDGNVAVAGFETRTDLGEFRNAWVRRILQ